MAIVYIDTRTFSNENMLGSVPVDRCVIGGAAWNTGLTKLYYQVYDDTNDNNIQERYIDFTNPVVPTFGSIVASSYSPTSATLDGSPVNVFAFAPTSGMDSEDAIYSLVPTDDAADTTYVIRKIGLVSNTPRYGSKQFTLPTSTSKIKGIAINGSYMYVLTQVASTGNETYICKIDLSSLTWNLVFAIPVQIIPVEEQTSLYTQDVLGSAVLPPIGVYIDALGNVCVVYDSDKDIIEKYEGSTLSYLGQTSFAYAGASNKSIMFAFKGVMYRITSDGADVRLIRYVDHATQVVEPTRSFISYDNRQIFVGENEVVTLLFNAIDGFGLPVTTAEGRNVKFEVITSRGAIDGNDVGLSSSSDPSSFRTITGIPIHRLLLSELNASGVATCYLQSARTTTTTLVQDTIKVTYPG
jgi:hypothetical protein